MPCCGPKPKDDEVHPSSEDEQEYKVGGRYRVSADHAQVWATKACQGIVVASYKHKDICMVLQLEKDRSDRQIAAYTVMPGKTGAGWISLQELKGANGKKVMPLERHALEGSWEMKAKYLVKNPATIRQGPRVDSGWVGEVNPGDEVLVLELTYTKEDAEAPARLRALVATSEDQIGWLSPETANGELLLESVNLFSEKVVDLHRQSLAGGKKGLPRGVRKSMTAGSDPPWVIGGMYRALEPIDLHSAPQLSSAKIAKVPEKAVLHFTDIRSVECPHMGQCPVACVTVKGSSQKGWIRCAAPDSRDLVTVHDLLEFEKVTQKMRTSVAMPGNVPLSAVQAEMIKANIPNVVAEEEEESEGGSGSSSEGGEDKEASASEYTQDGSSPAKTPHAPSADAIVISHKEPETVHYHHLPPASLEKFEVRHKDERLIQERTEMEDSSTNCGCNCGGGRV